MQEPEIIATRVAEPESKSKRNKLRKVGAVATTALAFVAAGKAEAAPQQESAMLAPTATASPELIGKKAEQGFKLRAIEELPGYGLKPSPEARKQLTASTVKIVKREKHVQSAWQEWCTGTKVSIGGEVFITSAKHCFNDLGWLSLRPKAKEKAQAGENPAINLAPNARYEYAVIDPGPKKRGWPTELPPVVAEIKDIVVDPSKPNDWALLKPDISKGGTGAPIFNAIPVMDIMKMTQKAVVGQEVVLYGLPQVTGHKPVAGKGVYIGEEVNADSNQRIAWVATRAKDQVHDPCLFGASGSSAITGGGCFQLFGTAQ